MNVWGHRQPWTAERILAIVARKGEIVAGPRDQVLRQMANTLVKEGRLVRRRGPVFGQVTYSVCVPTTK